LKNKKQTKGINKTIVIIAAVLALGIAYLSFSGILGGKISLTTIKELAKDKDLKIVTTTEEKILVSYINSDEAYTTDGELKEAYSIYLELEDGKIYLTNGDYSSRITDINEKVVFILDENNSCWLGGDDVYLLTENKNLYVLAATDINDTVDEPTPGNGGIKTTVYNKIKNNENQKLNIKRINGSHKVLAFTSFEGNPRGISCGSSAKVVYTSDKKLRIVTGNNINTIHTGYIGTIGYFGLLEYPGNKLGISGKEKIKDLTGKDLVYKKVFYIGGETDINYNSSYIIIDENNYIYIEKRENYDKFGDFGEMVDEVELYSTTLKYVSYSVANVDGKYILRIKLSNNSNLIYETNELEIK